MWGAEQAGRGSQGSSQDGSTISLAQVKGVTLTDDAFTDQFIPEHHTVLRRAACLLFSARFGLSEYEIWACLERDWPGEALPQV